MIKTPSERQATSRAKKKAAGFVRTTLRLDSKTIARLRRLAKRDGVPQAKIIEAALLLFESKELLKDVQAWAAAQREAK